MYAIAHASTALLIRTWRCCRWRGGPNVSLMFPPQGTFASLASSPANLPTIILLDIVATWLVIWALARKKIILETTPPPLAVG